jgi:hypothetical protein
LLTAIGHWSKTEKALVRVVGRSSKWF